MQQKEIYLISGFPPCNGFKKLSSLESMAVRARAWLRVSSLFPSSPFPAPSPLADIDVSNLISGFCVCLFSISLWVPKEWAYVIHLWVSITQAWLQTYVKCPENLAQSFPPKVHSPRASWMWWGIYLRFLRAVDPESARWWRIQTWYRTVRPGTTERKPWVENQK